GVAAIALGVWINVSQSRAFRAAGIQIHPEATPVRLRRDGLYRWSRNPMYGGMVLALVGASLASSSWWSLFVAPLFAAYLASRFIGPEERRLESELGDAYRAYRREVRRWI